MAKAIIALFTTLCILAFATLTHSHRPEVFDVEGDVYCDPCRVMFETKLSQKIAGATVKLECTDLVTENVTFSVEGVCDSNGHYKLTVKGDRENDICKVKLIKSPDAKCNLPMGSQETAEIECTENSGMHSLVRYANPLGFMTKEAVSGCKEVLRELGMDPEDLGLDLGLTS